MTLPTDWFFSFHPDANEKTPGSFPPGAFDLL
jgi:hypothetical protein